MRKRSRPPRPPSREWTPEEDAKLREVNELGLVDDLWHLAIPDRLPIEMYERRMVLGIKPAPLI